MSIKIPKKLFVLVVLIVAAGVSAYIISANYTKTVPQEEFIISPKEVKESIDNNQKVTLVDVRRSDEYEAGHLKDSLLLTLDTIDKKAAEVIPDKNKTYYIYCRTGRRSALAVTQLQEMGYANVYDMKGGINEWSGLGYPVVK